VTEKKKTSSSSSDVPFRWYWERGD